MFRTLLAAAVLLVPGSLVGQRLTPLPSYAVAALPPLSSAPRFDRVLSASAFPRTYWLEGGVLGGIGVGVLSALWFRGMSESSNRTGATAAGFVLGGAVGFTAGALIGGQFRKFT